MTPSLTLAEIQRIRNWHLVHRDAHPLEYQLWDAVLCLWLMGWVGWLPAFVLDQFWACPLCLLASGAPQLYVAWRRHAHLMQRLRCDWLSGSA